MDKVETIKVALAGSWRHSHEEDTENGMIFRPGNYDFPPSRGRVGYEFHTDGSCTIIGIAPADGYTSNGCHWHHDEEDPHTIFIVGESKLAEKLILKFDADGNPLMHKSR